MFTPGDVRDLIREAQEDDEAVTWDVLVDKANRQGHSSSDFEKALAAAKDQGLVLEPQLGEFVPL